MAKEKVKLGVVGMSDGNGHPYSWSAIFNGFDVKAMSTCSFSAIPNYLNEQIFPQDFLCDLGEVTCVYTQDLAISEHIAEASKIEHIANSLDVLCDQVDAVLMARDDAENHPDWVMPILRSGKPVFVDKPFAIKLEDAHRMFEEQQYEGQIYTCSSLRYAEELVSEELYEGIGAIEFVEAFVPKFWSTYSIHVIEPVFNALNDHSKIIEVKPLMKSPIHKVSVRTEERVYVFNATKNLNSTINIKLHGTKGERTLVFKDSFSAFKTSLEAFVRSIGQAELPIPREETLRYVEIIEKGS